MLELCQRAQVENLFCDELRIIAGEKGTLDVLDRAKIEAAADELERSHNAESWARYELNEAIMRLSAVTDQLTEARRRQIELIEQMAAMKRENKAIREPLRFSVDMAKITIDAPGLVPICRW